MGAESQDGFGINRTESQISYAESRRSRVERRQSHIPLSTFRIRNAVYSRLGVKEIGDNQKMMGR
jgi:hypothetical protein